MTSPGRLLETTTEDGTSRLPRAPLVVALVVALVVVGCAAFVRTAVDRAARAVVRGQVMALTDAVVPEVYGAADKEHAVKVFHVVHAAEGLRYISVTSPSGDVVSAGEPRGEGGPTGRDPVRIHDRVRVAPSEGLVFEIETETANDVHAAGLVAFVVAFGVAGVVVALGIAYSRALRMREVLRTRLDAERRLAALGELSAVLAHELKNPLTSLKGNAQLLVEGLAADGAKAGHTKKADRVVREAMRLEQLVADLVGLVRLGTIDRREVDPREPIDAAVEAAGGTVEVTWASAGATWNVDPGRLRVAVENVVRNAVHASGGRKVHVGVSEDAASFIVDVRDEGAGIPAGEERAIFEPFRTNKASGTGLGLAIARRIVELHGGSLSARNHAEGGAVFRITLPRPRS